MSAWDWTNLSEIVWSFSDRTITDGKLVAAVQRVIHSQDENSCTFGQELIVNTKMKDYPFVFVFIMHS